MIWLHVACNDPDNGFFAFRAPEIGICDCELEARSYGVGPAFVELDDIIRFSGKHWSFDRMKYGVGNWCWNAYRLMPETRKVTHRWYWVDFLVWLRGRDLYRCTTGESRFYDWFNNKEYQIPKSELHTLLCELEQTTVGFCEGAE